MKQVYGVRLEPREMAEVRQRVPRASISNMLRHALGFPALELGGKRPRAGLRKVKAADNAR